MESNYCEKVADVGESNNGVMVRQQLTSLGYGIDKMKKVVNRCGDSSDQMLSQLLAVTWPEEKALYMLTTC
ncbi:hypothetical protein Pmar_PMAR008517 [Perkinsus marinus ATCC 50983]|uniref:Uncharacterized protein n=1 Tax=Perkinsus marinus (strain ATCC 50983 / TXsc) TaxID=423536 RepID=C5M1M3_PERM5|nr:hypothetical protein Pmar_PMAR008517 [Perkinsus marinus ATCC 50983]EEQ97116.1 hypothetical protein Pmar_PMAR008517 [Perkinsus marinus ATCC 50983]|eukprot:XP_002764399.1 hypothetical protein Pmar_PMAR008517 [Perkinsus marinus ATCC 50983]